jgi:hypothetical protein
MAAIINNSRQKPMEEGAILEKLSLCFYLIVAQKSYIPRQTLFTLPSGRISQPLLNTAHSRTSIITHVFMHMVTPCRKCLKNRHCCVMFDEMSIRENAWSNQKLVCFEGFEDLGSQGLQVEHCKSRSTFHGLLSAPEVEAAGGICPQSFK